MDINTQLLQRKFTFYNKKLSCNLCVGLYYRFCTITYSVTALFNFKHFGFPQALAQNLIFNQLRYCQYSMKG